MKRLVTSLITLVLMLFYTTSFAQSAKQVFMTAFPEVYGSLNLENTTKYDPAKKVEYRNLYAKLSDALGEIKAFKIGAKKPEDMLFFDYKDLKRLQKDQKLDSLEILIKNTQHKLSDLMRYEPFGADSIKAVKNLAALRQYYKVDKDLDKAYHPWTVLFHEYPKIHKVIYVWGRKIVKHKIKTAKDSAERSAWIDTLILLYDQYMEMFPKYKLYTLTNKVIDFYNYKILNHNLNDSTIRERIVQDYYWAKQAIEMGGKKTPARIYPFAMALSVYMYKMGKITPEQFVNDYMLFSDNMKYAYDNAKKTKLKQAYKKYMANIDQLFRKTDLATCENYEKIFGSKYDSLKSDIEFLKKVLDLMTKEGCMMTEFFEKVAIDLYNVEPSAKMAYTLSLLLAKKEKYEEAAKYAEEAIRNCTENDSLKAEYYFNAAKIYHALHNFVKARQMAYEALKLRPNWGEPYILIAAMYAESAPNCGDDDFKHSAVYWAAVDKLLKAKEVDPSVADKVQQAISTYSAHFPKRKDGFLHTVYEGQKFTIDYCWINETTTARYLK